MITEVYSRTARMPAFKYGFPLRRSILVRYEEAEVNDLRDRMVGYVNKRLQKNPFSISPF